MNGTIALEARGVSKRYGDHDALRDVDLVALSGQVHGLLGPNGAGKTTLLRILLGLVRRDAGSLRLLGRPVGTFGGPLPDDVAGFVETPAFYGYLSGRRNLELLAALDLRAGGGMVTVEEAIVEVHLEAHADAAVAGYSAGLRQRLGLAAALLRAPRLLLLDEPTSSLDPATARAVRAATRRLADDGVAVVLSSHDMVEVEELCGAVTIIDRGRVIFTGGVGELRATGERPVWELRTSDDAAAAAIGARHPDVKVLAAGAAMELAGTQAALDALVIALGRHGIAVRHLQQRPRTLESTFLQLTGAASDADGAAASLAAGARET
ncbi:MAG TPA: ABC transporter ATP-binding protein [Vicinamibacterales bacterium]|jgi:ABC-2 type transport system ATP-binding protein